MNGVDFMKPKFINKYLKMAHAICQDNNACFSRTIGCIIVDNNHKIRGAGYNGAPRGVPHCDTDDHYLKIVKPQVSQEEWLFLIQQDRKNKCPRKILGYPSGEQVNICSCGHAESNAIVSSSDDLHNCHLFLWGATPCLNCAAMIIQAGIKFVYCSGFTETYKNWEGAKWLLEKASIQVYLQQK